MANLSPISFAPWKCSSPDICFARASLSGTNATSTILTIMSPSSPVAVCIDFLSSSDIFSAA